MRDARGFAGTHQIPVLARPDVGGFGVDHACRLLAELVDDRVLSCVLSCAKVLQFSKNAHKTGIGPRLAVAAWQARTLKYEYKQRFVCTLRAEEVPA
jgi:hypothetical protein